MKNPQVQGLEVKSQSKNSLGWPLNIRWNSIYRRLLVTYVALTTLGTSILAAYILWSFYGYFMRTRQSELNTWATALSESVGDALEEGDLKRADLTIQRYGKPESVTLRIFNPEGRLLATSAPEIDRQIRDWKVIPTITQSLKPEATQGVAKGVLSNDDRLYSTQPIIRNGRFLGVLRMSITLKQFQRQFQTVVFTVLGTLFLTVVLCALISEWLARNMAQPIQAMRNFAIQIGSGHLGEKLQIQQEDELGQLATELNRMSERLASLDKERRAFLASVSHELRTPVSNVLVTVEALKSGASEEIELRDRFIQTVEDETRRLSRLIHDLLDLGRLEAGVAPLEKQPINLRNLLNRAVRAMESRMRSKGMSIDLNVTDIKLQGDPERLLQAFLNILDNAVKHSGSSSTVFIQGRTQNGQAIVTIRDQGPGISAAELPHIFEQFYTGDPSRQGSSTGLGLAIARRIVEAHAGVITVSSSPGRGATFHIKLPCTPSSP